MVLYTLSLFSSAFRSNTIFLIQQYHMNVSFVLKTLKLECKICLIECLRRIFVCCNTNTGPYSMNRLLNFFLLTVKVIKDHLQHHIDFFFFCVGEICFALRTL